MSGLVKSSQVKSCLVWPLFMNWCLSKYWAGFRILTFLCQEINQLNEDLKGTWNIVQLLEHARIVLQQIIWRLMIYLQLGKV